MDLQQTPRDESPDTLAMRRREARALASERGAAMRRQAHRIRRNVAVAAVTTFLAMFSVIGVRLATGHDPALTANARRAAAQAAVVELADTTAATTTSTTATPSTSATGTGATAKTTATGADAAVTTATGESAAATTSSASASSSSPSTVTTSQS